MLKLLLAPVVALVLLLEGGFDPDGYGTDTYLDTREIKLPSKRELRLMTYEELLHSWNPWTRKGKMVKKMAEKLLNEVRSGPRETGAHSN